MSRPACYGSMDRIEFEARVEGEGLIRIPEEYARSLAKGELVHVSARAKRPERRTVKRMREHPIPAPGFKPFPREELYDRPE